MSPILFTLIDNDNLAYSRTQSHQFYYTSVTYSTGTHENRQCHPFYYTKSPDLLILIDIDNYICSITPCHLQYSIDTIYSVTQCHLFYWYQSTLKVSPILWLNGIYTWHTELVIYISSEHPRTPWVIYISPIQRVISISSLISLLLHTQHVICISTQPSRTLWVICVNHWVIYKWLWHNTIHCNTLQHATHMISSLHIIYSILLTLSIPLHNVTYSIDTNRYWSSCLFCYTKSTTASYRH